MNSQNPIKKNTNIEMINNKKPEELKKSDLWKLVK